MSAKNRKARVAYWKTIKKEEREERMRAVALRRWNATEAEERKAYAYKMVAGRQLKKAGIIA